LALAVTESGRIEASTQSLVAVLATGFVLFTLLVNGLTLRPVMRVLKLDRLSPLNKALRSKVLALALAEVRGAVAQTSRDFELAPATTEAVIADLTTRPEADGLEDEAMISDQDRITVAWSRSPTGNAESSWAITPSRAFRAPPLNAFCGRRTFSSTPRKRTARPAMRAAPRASSPIHPASGSRIFFIGS
jgi:hypothetical protein